MTDIYIEYVCYLYLMQYVNLMVRMILTDCSRLAVHTSIAPHETYLSSCSDCSELTTLSFYADVSSSEDCQQDGILGNLLLFCVAALKVLHPQCDYEILTNCMNFYKAFLDLTECKVCGYTPLLVP